MKFLGVSCDGRYQVVERERIVAATALRCWPYQVRWGDRIQALANARLAVERWELYGLPHRMVGDQVLYDPCMAGNFISWSARNHGDPLFEGDLIPAWQRSVRELAANNGTLGNEWTHFRLNFRREFNLRGRAGGSLVRLRVPLALNDDSQQSIAVSLIEPADAVQVKREPGRLEVQVCLPRQPDVTSVTVCQEFLCKRVSFAVDGMQSRPCDLPDAERAIYTRPREGLIQVTASVERLAHDLAGDASPPLTAIDAFWKFFFTRMSLGSLHYDEFDAADPLGSLVEGGWFDCLTGSALLAGLCRAAGIPARLVNGLSLYATEMTNHYWVEAYVSPWGWMPLDLVSWALAAGSLECEEWSRYFYFHMDHRMKYQCLPHLMIGNIGIRLPASWYMLTAIKDGGTETTYVDLATGDFVYRDWIAAERLPADERAEN